MCPNIKNKFSVKNVQIPALEESVVRRRPVASPLSSTIVDVVVAGPADEDGGGAKAKSTRGEGGGGGGGGGALQKGAGEIV